MMKGLKTILCLWTTGLAPPLMPQQEQHFVSALVAPCSTRMPITLQHRLESSVRVGRHHTAALSLVVDSDVDPVVRKRRLATSMAYLTGLSDVALSLQFQTFATMLTGNLMWLSRALMERNLQTTLYYASVFASYLAGLSLVRLMRKKNPKTILRITGAATMALFLGADMLFYGAELSRWIPVCMLSAAYGGINSMGTDFAGTLTFVVTGHLTRLAHLLTDLFVERKIMTEADVTAAKQSAGVTGGFFAGALTGFYLLSRNLLLRQGFFTALGVCYGILFFSYDGRRIKRWWKRRQVPEMMIKPPSIEVVQTSDALEGKEAVAAAVSDAISEEKDVVVVVVNNSTLTTAEGENSTLSIASSGEH